MYIETYDTLFNSKLEAEQAKNNRIITPTITSTMWEGDLMTSNLGTFEKPSKYENPNFLIWAYNFDNNSTLESLINKTATVYKIVNEEKVALSNSAVYPPNIDNSWLVIRIGRSDIDFTSEKADLYIEFN